MSNERDRTLPYKGKLRWVPLSSKERPPASPFDDLLLWNPCDGAWMARWDGSQFVLEGGSTNIGSATHWALVEGPQPAEDISVNWRLYQGHRQRDNGGPR